MSLGNKAPDTEVRNIVMVALTVLVESLQLLIIVVTIFHYIPIQLDPFVYTLFPKHQAGVLPEREMFFYRFFVFSNLLMQAFLLYVFRRRLADPSLASSLKRWIAVQSVGIALQVFAIFKILLHGEPRWAFVVFYCALGLSLLSRVFWPEVNRWGRILFRECMARDAVTVHRRWLDGAAVIFTVIIIWIPDVHKALARIFVNDRFYHFDGFLMAPAWAHQSGVVLGRDVISQYSTVLPKIVAFMTQLTGGLSYAAVLSAMMIFTVIYYILFYVFARQLYGRASVAIFVLCLGLKLQMFHYGVFPLVWQFLTPLVIRYMFDMACLLFLLKHLRTDRRAYLWAASVITGVAMGYMTDTGLYLLLAFYSYLFCILTLRPYREKAFVFPPDVPRVFGLILTPWLAAAAMLLVFNGPLVFQADFWINQSEHIRLFLQGWGSLPMYDGLKERQFFAFVMGFVIPAVYVWTLLSVGTFCALSKEKREDLIMAVISVYGLATYHYFIYRSAVTSYYVVGLPFVLVIGYWLHQITRTLPLARRRAVMLTMLLLSVGALLTNRFYMIYPNSVNTWFLDWEQEEEFYKREFAFAKDVALIQKLTLKDERVPVISSFEVKLLMDAERKPFFYYFPLIESGHMRGDHFHGTYLHTRERMHKTIGQLDHMKPEYVFVEAKLFQGGLRPEYYSHYKTLTELVHYMSQHYEIVEQGQYLTALRRKP